MTELLYKYDKCSECGQEGFQWGMLISISMRSFNDESGEFTYTDVTRFICYDCIKTVLIKLDDLIEQAKHKTSDDGEKHKPDKDARYGIMRF